MERIERERAARIEIEPMSNVIPMMAIPKSKPATDVPVARIVGEKGSKVAVTAQRCNGKTIITIKQGPDVIAFDALSWHDIVAGVRSALKGNP